MFPFDRRVYFINKDFQSRFILRFVLTTSFWALAAVALFTVIAGRRLQDVLYSPHISIQSSVELLMPSALQAHLLSFVLFGAVLFLALRALWKRLSLPLYSLKKDIARIAAGDLVSGVSLREGEEFQDLAFELDGMRNGLRSRFSLLKERRTALSEAVRELERAVWKGTPSLAQAAAVKKAAEQLRGGLDGFSN
ncbi:MAG: hypothetical protein A2X56_06010 [Nitrospirae bacterium GWC2_57_13]|nr:MAG: hypothetical protein A2X56_06010 [Nitrospirae bacterium GWC2_57_13]HAS55402.1 hypothetical protein [Nitrospiraceae bacterium]